MFYVNEEAAEAFSRIKVIADLLASGPIPDQVPLIGDWLAEIAKAGLNALEEKA
jgi:hypothetical protein